jgi:hypothetical protein
MLDDMDHADFNLSSSAPMGGKHIWKEGRKKGRREERNDLYMSVRVCVCTIHIFRHLPLQH